MGSMDGFFRKILIFLNFKSLYLYDYWFDFKKFTHKINLKILIGFQKKSKQFCMLNQIDFAQVCMLDKMP